MIAEVERAEQRCFESVKGTTDQPYFFAIDIFVGHWGGADEVAYGKLESRNGRATVNGAHLSINKNVAKADAARVEVWINSVDLRANGGGRFIHDLRYGGGSTLSSRFSENLSNSNKWCRRTLCHQCEKPHI